MDYEILYKNITLRCAFHKYCYIFCGAPTSMGKYCPTRRRMRGVLNANSPRMARGVGLASYRPGLGLTALAAQWGTREKLYVVIELRRLWFYANG